MIIIQDLMDDMELPCVGLTSYLVVLILQAIRVWLECFNFIWSFTCYFIGTFMYSCCVCEILVLGAIASGLLEWE